MTELPVGQLLCVGIRGAVPGDPTLERDLESCARAGVGAVLLFDVDLPTRRRLEREGLDAESAARKARRNITGPDALRELIAYLRERLGSRLLVSIDQEGGRVARLSPRHGFAADPSAVEFAGLDASARAAAAAMMATRLRSLDIDLNFAPCVDLALDPDNEIIVKPDRSFGRDPASVVEAARAVLEAHAKAGVAACLKHFPGHGSSRGDTHRGTVEITQTWQREIELEPYRALASQPGVAVMVAHVLHRGMDPELPASLSPRLIAQLLRKELGFGGVVVTDSIDMHAIADRWSGEQASVAAIAAGADLVVDGFNLDERDVHPAPALVTALRKALEDGRIPGGAARIEQSLRRLDHLRAQIYRARSPEST